MINPLQTTKSGRGIVSVRVALLLRFTEIKPCSYDLFRLYLFLIYDMNSSPFNTLLYIRSPNTLFIPFLFLLLPGPGLHIVIDLGCVCVWCVVLVLVVRCVGVWCVLLVLVVRCVVCTSSASRSSIYSSQRGCRVCEQKKRPQKRRGVCVVCLFWGVFFGVCVWCGVCGVVCACECFPSASAKP